MRPGPRAPDDGDQYALNGTKAWITHGGIADYYTIFARTGREGGRGSRPSWCPADAEGLSFAASRRRRWACTRPRRAGRTSTASGSTPTRRIGEEGQGLHDRPVSALDSGRLGSPPCHNGLAQAALDQGPSYATGAAAVRPADREQPGTRAPHRRHGGGRHAARATYLHAARLGRRRAFRSARRRPSPSSSPPTPR